MSGKLVFLAQRIIIYAIRIIFLGFEKNNIKSN